LEQGLRFQVPSNARIVEPMPVLEKVGLSVMVMPGESKRRPERGCTRSKAAELVSLDRDPIDDLIVKRALAQTKLTPGITMTVSSELHPHPRI